MELENCLNYLNKELKRGSIYGLKAINALLDRLNRPEQNFKVIHIAGTNGKGSVTCYLTNILKTTYKVGTFNSPSVFSFNESFLINNKPIDDDTLQRALTVVINEVEKMKEENFEYIPTHFEMLFATALIIFKMANVDFAIIECGMGGKNDATNALSDKLISVITHISLDHIDILGDNVTKIAEEKFGICTKYLVTSEQTYEVMKVLKKAPRLYVAKEPTLLISNSSGQTFKYGIESYKIQMQGAHQLENASIALCCIKLLRLLGYWINKRNIKKGIFQAKIAGRCERILAKDKVFILDGSHNPSGCKALKEILNSNYKLKRKTYVFSCFKDKDYDTMLSIMKDNANIYISKAPSERSVDVNDCKIICEKYFNNVITNTSISEAIKNAFYDNNQLIVVFGSLSILKEAKDCIRGIIDEQNKN